MAVFMKNMDDPLGVKNFLLWLVNTIADASNPLRTWLEKHRLLLH